MGWRHACEGLLVRWGVTGLTRVGVRYELALHGSHETVWPDTLSQSRAVRTALQQQHPAHRQSQRARETLAACHKRGVGLRAHRGAFGVGQVAITHRERATVPLLRAIEQQSVMLAVLLLDKAEARASDAGGGQAPMQGSLF
jgi:hypothetical protein